MDVDRMSVQSQDPNASTLHLQESNNTNSILLNAMELSFDDVLNEMNIPYLQETSDNTSILQNAMDFSFHNMQHLF